MYTTRMTAAMNTNTGIAIAGPKTEAFVPDEPSLVPVSFHSREGGLEKPSQVGGFFGLFLTNSAGSQYHA